MLNLPDVAIFMAVRYESKDREENVESVLDYILKNFNAPVYVIEADKERSANFAWLSTTKYANTNVNYTYKKDDLPYFCRTNYLQTLLTTIEKPIVVFWDADMVIEPKQLLESIEHIRSKQAVMSIPFGWEKLHYTRKSFNLLFRDTLDFNLVSTVSDGNFIYKDARVLGGVAVLAREEYLKCGGENPNIIGYGPDDCDRVNRVTIITGKDVLRTNGPGIHLFHERTLDSTRHNINFAKNEQEMVKVAHMSKAELLNYITTWRK